MILLSWDLLSLCMTTATWRSQACPTLTRFCLMTSPVSSLAGDLWAVRRHPHTHICYKSHAHHWYKSVTIIPALSLHALFSQTVGASLPSCRRLGSPLSGTQSAPSLAGGATMLRKPWSVPEGMEWYQAARYSKHMCAHAGYKAVLPSETNLPHTKLTLIYIFALFHSNKNI